jgi:hypothetical protein
MWYVAVDEGLTRSTDYTTSLRQAYAESDDGIHWRRPSLGLVKYRGSRDSWGPSTSRSFTNQTTRTRPVATR